MTDFRPVKEGDKKPITIFEIKGNTHYYNGIPESFIDRMFRLNGVPVTSPLIKIWQQSGK